MVGRPPKLSVVQTAHLTKKEKSERKEAESKMKVNRNLIAPTYLSADARAEFDRIVKESEPLDIIDNMDLSFLAMYCDAYVKYVEIIEELNTLELVDENGLNKVVYDLAKLQEKYKQTIMQCSSKLGLATSDRLRLVIPKGKDTDENPFMKYMP